ncbi:hypothetical protein CRH02_06825 [Escherichia albertii]|nr:hypothetical protein CRH02_06825 [Escherichia albertii]
MLPLTLVTIPFRFTVQGANGKLYYETFPQEFTADTRAAQEQARYEYKLKYDQEQAQKKAQEQQKTKVQQSITTQNTSTKNLKVPSCGDDNAISSLRETFVEDFQDSQLKDAFYEMNLFNITEFKLINSHPDANECQGDVEWIVNPDKKPSYVPIYYTFYSDGKITYDRDAFWSEIKKTETSGKSKNPTVFPKNAPPSTYSYSQATVVNQPSVSQSQIKELTCQAKANVKGNLMQQGIYAFTDAKSVSITDHGNMFYWNYGHGTSGNSNGDIFGDEADSLPVAPLTKQGNVYSNRIQVNGHLITNTKVIQTNGVPEYKVVVDKSTYSFVDCQ